MDMKRPAFKYERRGQRVASRLEFSDRFLKHFLLATLIIVVALAAGMVGYMYFACMSPLDAFLNASMILSGMGPVDELYRPSAKIFAGLYAIISGLLFFAVAGLILAPVLHRILHRFHMDEQD
jgi:sterol desaturase/sphingolipid hydroxylase (fatty acid hydroxylase superfamily)